MARPLRIEYPGAFYHVTSRGNERKAIFRSTADREKFLCYLGSASRRYGARIHAYCLMSNHYHLLVETPGGNLSQIMRHVNGAYTTYFNVKRQRAGHLLQGRYKAVLVEREAYALELSGYIHRNPVRAGIAQRAEEYPWSSYRCYVGEAASPGWLVREVLLAGLGADERQARKNYGEFVGKTGLEEPPSPLEQVVGSVLLGSEGFVEWVKREFLEGRPFAADIPALKVLRNRPTIADVREVVKARLDADSALARRVSLYLCRRLTGCRLKEIGEAFGVGESAVSQASRRVSEELTRNRDLQDRVRELENALGVSGVQN